MKKFIYLIVMSICLVFNFTGCSDFFASDNYSVEKGIVSNSRYEIALKQAKSYGADLNYENIKSIRDYLYESLIYENRLSDHEKISDVDNSEIHSFLKKHGFSKEEANFEMEFLENNGNDILFFENTESSSSKVWMYIEKE